MDKNIEFVVPQFDIPDGAWTAEPYGNGHINDTYLVTTGEGRFILQPQVIHITEPARELILWNAILVDGFIAHHLKSGL